MPIRTVFFDLDGTLSDFKAACEVILDTLHDEFPEIHPFVDQRSFVAHYWDYIGKREAEQRAGIIPMQVLQDRTKRFREVLTELGVPPEQAAQYAPRFSERYDYHRQTAPRLFSGVKDTLEALQGQAELGVITQGIGTSQRRQLQNLGIEHYFQHIFVTGEVGHVKPELDLYRACLSRAEVSPGEAVMVGDRLDWDLAPTHHLGLTTVLFRDNSLYFEPGMEHDDRVHHVVDNHAELRPLLLKLITDSHRHKR